MAYVGTYLLLSVAVFLLFLLTGRVGDRLWRHLEPTADEGLLLRLILGIGIWTAGLFALAAFQLLGPVPVLAGAGLAALAGGWTLVRGGPIRGRFVQAAEAVRRNARDPLVAVGVLVLTAVGAALFLQVLRPIVAWDADVYHLTVPRLFVEHGGFERVPFNLYSNWPSNVHLLYVLALILKDYILAKAIHFGLGVCLAIAVGRWVARRSGARWGVFSAAVLLTSPVYLFEIRVAYVDIALALFLFAGFVFCDRALASTGGTEQGWLGASGLACGLLAGAKLNGIVGAAAIATVFVGSRLLSGRGLATLIRPIVLFGVPVLLFAGPWFVKSLWFTGNPVYPLLYGVFGGPEWSHDLASAHGAWHRSIGMGREPLDFLLLLPRVLLLGGEGYGRFDGRLSPIVAILLLAGLAASRRRPEIRRALAVAGLWFAAWAVVSQQMRLLIPTLPLLAAAGALAAHDLASRLAGGRLWAERAAVLGAVVLAAVANLHYLGQAPGLATTLASRGTELQQNAAPPVYRFLNQLPEESKILFINVNRGFFSARDFIADSVFEASQVADWLSGLGSREAMKQGLDELGITHVLVKREAGGPIFPAAFLALVEDPAHRLIYDAEDTTGSFFIVELP